MFLTRLVSAVIILAYVCDTKEDDDEFLWDTFPPGFLWGTATSSYQIEGAWDADGKGENIWDRFTHGQGWIENNDTGDVACDSYNKWQTDIQMVQDLEVDYYRFSLSWARILPDGTPNIINQPGVDYYNNLIDGLIEADIEPMVTLYHWDLPQDLQDDGGWMNVTIVDHFKEYARVCYELFGDRVKTWITLNEPWVIAEIGHGMGIFAPGVREPAEMPYLVGHHILKAHAEAWRLYDEDFRTEQHGIVGITINSDWKEPLNSSNPEDVEAADRAIQFQFGWFANAIFLNGDYPEVMKSQVAMKSELQGYPQSRLPEFTEEEKDRIRGTYDFLGLNHYTTILIEHFERPLEHAGYFFDQDVSESKDPDWPTSGSLWLRMVPWGFRKLLNWIKDEYGNPPVIVTENGISDRNSSLDDDFRINYYREYTNQMLKAIRLDNCNVDGYTAWSLMDNFEWYRGYAEKFGLYQVDFEDDDRPRTPKASAAWYKQLVEDHGFIEPDE